jgi:hypothetical protein
VATALGGDGAVLSGKNLLGSEQIGFWDENGYLLVEGIIPEEKIGEMNDHMDAIRRGDIQLSGLPEGRNGTLQGHLYDPFMMQMALYCSLFTVHYLLLTQ